MVNSGVLDRAGPNSRVTNGCQLFFELLACSNVAYLIASKAKLGLYLSLSRN